MAITQIKSTVATIKNPETLLSVVTTNETHRTVMTTSDHVLVEAKIPVPTTNPTATVEAAPTATALPPRAVASTAPEMTNTTPKNQNTEMKTRHTKDKEEVNLMKGETKLWEVEKHMIIRLERM